MRPPVIELTQTELAFAALTASIRRESARADDLDTNRHSPISDWYTDFIGTQAEIAFAKWANVYWDASNRSFKRPDVGTMQVRGTHHLDGCLIIRPNDGDRDSFVFVTVSRSRCSLIGWLHATAARLDDYWREDAWWVPQPRLNSMEELNI